MFLGQNWGDKERNNQLPHEPKACARTAIWQHQVVDQPGGSTTSTDPLGGSTRQGQRRP